MRYLLFLCFLIAISSCNSLTTTEQTSENKQKELQISDESIFNLDTKWRTEEGKEIELKELKGKTLVMVMIYTNCKAACPRLVADMKAIAEQIPADNKKEIQYVLVSIDPDADTPEKLKKFAIDKEMDGEEWTFLQGDKK
jgi:protein SCO1/2